MHSIRANCLVVFFGIFALVVGCVNFAVAEKCDIIVHLKSNTTKQFQGQIIAPSGEKSEKFDIFNVVVEIKSSFFQMELHRKSSEGKFSSKHQ